MTGECYCGSDATVLIDTDSWQYPDGLPVCEDHDTGDRPETRVIPGLPKSRWDVC